MTATIALFRFSKDIEDKLDFIGRDILEIKISPGISSRKEG